MITIPIFPLFLAWLITLALYIEARYAVIFDDVEDALLTWYLCRGNTTILRKQYGPIGAVIIRAIDVYRPKRRYALQRAA